MNTLTANDVAMAHNFLANYQTQTRNGLYGEFNSILSKVDAVKNSSTTVGNIKLDITTLEKDTTFQWKYVANGIEAPDKCVALRYTNGFLNYFINDWNLYKVGSTEINLTEKDAINIAIDKAKNYSSDNAKIGTIGGLKFNITNAMIVETFLTPAVYAGADKARSQDLFELYPMYNVWVSLDKFYPGNVYGFNVYVWADTKEAYYINQRVSTIDPPAWLIASATNNIQPSDSQTFNSFAVLMSNNSLSTVLLILLVCTATILIMTPVYLSIKKKSVSLFSLPKTLCLKTGGMLLCLLILFPVLIAMSASPVTAATVGGATVWGAESEGSINYNLNPPESWRKTKDEVLWQRNTSAYIDGLFDANGYVSTNNQGSNNYGSNKGPILDQIQFFETNYPRVAVVNFDHGNGKNNTDISGASSGEFHYLFEDNWGTYEGETYNNDTTYSNQHAIFDANIYQKTVANKTFFAFINTCNSAHVGNDYYGYVSSQGLVDDSVYKARGMPFVWSHGLKVTDTPTSTPEAGWMSRNGYSTADSNDFCFIGFESGSAALDQPINSSDYHYYYWVYHFFHYALECDYTIHTALDLASQDTFYGSPNFDSSPLSNSNGFTAIWPMYINDDWDYENYSVPNCYMRVYGNSYIKLYQPLLTLSARDNNNNPLSPVFTIDDTGYGSTSIRVTNDEHYITVTDNIFGFRFDHFSFNGYNYGSNPSQIPITVDGTLTAHYVPDQHVYVASSEGGYTDPAYGYYRGSGSMQVTAYPYSGYQFSYWLLNSEYLSSNPTINVDYGSNTVQPVFEGNPSYGLQ